MPVVVYTETCCSNYFSPLFSCRDQLQKLFDLALDWLIQPTESMSRYECQFFKIWVFSQCISKIKSVTQPPFFYISDKGDS